MSSQFQIVFKGQLLEGFELAAVKASAARRLKATPEQVDRLFSGKRAILKKSLADDAAQRYAAELQRIGMQVAIEPEVAKPPAPSIEPVAHDPIGEISIAATPPVSRSEPQRVTSRDEPVFDPMKTQIADVAGDPPPPPERWSQPTIAVSQKHMSSMQPTIAAPALRATNSSSEPTIVVTRGSASRQPVASDDASAPTLVVPPRRSQPDDDSSAPTLIVPPRRSAASEPTMIVSPRQSAASAPTIIVRSNDRPPLAGNKQDEAGSFDAERTLLANNEMVEEYSSPDTGIDSRAPQPTPAPRTPIPAAPPASEEMVQCPTCGDNQPKRVYCRRCGHALSLPPKQPSMGESTITKKTFTLPPKPKPAVAPSASEETVLVSEHEDLPVETKSAARKTEFLAAPTWFMIGLMFVLLLAVAGWLLFS
ncbi:hypothetical protein VVD49_19455 [Uliginosibacterium sp. H3]|uniref:Zinc ribbon domain-containing protein n=1 Tax=Uliginosibacterium silvisoli TaxID=3114758 RepID=A0ABU6K8H2_9RHOO|nr:hypothetical protein [Uliginosibacterium sp. H3]